MMQDKALSLSYTQIGGLTSILPVAYGKTTACVLFVIQESSLMSQNSKRLRAGAYNSLLSVCKIVYWRVTEQNPVATAQSIQCLYASLCIDANVLVSTYQYSNLICNAAALHHSNLLTTSWKNSACRFDPQFNTLILCSGASKFASGVLGARTSPTILLAGMQTTSIITCR